MPEDVSIERLQALGQPFFGYGWILEVHGGPVAADLETVTLRCTSASIPGATHNTAGRDFVNQHIEYPSRSEYHGTLTTTFQIYTDLAVRQLMNDWSNLIQGHASGVGLEFPELTASVVMRLLNANPRGGGDVAQDIGLVRLKLAFPQEIGEVDLEHGNDDQSSFDVTWQYNDFEIETV